MSRRVVTPVIRMALVAASAVWSGVALGADAASFFFQPTLVDEPDSWFQDTNGDGIDGMAQGPVFVSHLHGDDFNPGTIRQPVRNLATGVLLASRYRTDVYVDRTGTHTLPVILDQGIRIYGGYGAFTKLATSWTRQSVSKLRVPSPIALRLHSNGEAVVLMSFEVSTGTGTPGLPHSIAIALTSSSPMNVLMDSVQVVSGFGAPGVPGAHGADGVAGLPGNPGMIGAFRTAFSVGPAGGPGVFYGTGDVRNSGAGGSGGGFAGVPQPGQRGVSLVQGFPSGVGGLAGNPFVAGNGGNASPAGRSGLDGAHGAWTEQGPVSAAPGEGGQGGSGGGGGGSASVSPSGFLMGSSGGGGGGGAKGGQPGQNGGKGGGSIGLYYPSPHSSFFDLSNSFLYTQSGGVGGRGGDGGRWAAGGVGGPGALSVRSGSSLSGASGAGAAGGSSGAGGAGAGGPGGDSVGFLSAAGITQRFGAHPSYLGGGSTGGQGGIALRASGESRAPQGPDGSFITTMTTSQPFDVDRVQEQGILASNFRHVAQLNGTTPVRATPEVMLANPSRLPYTQFSLVRAALRGSVTLVGNRFEYRPHLDAHDGPFEDRFTYRVMEIASPGGPVESFEDFVGIVSVLRYATLRVRPRQWAGGEIRGWIGPEELSFVHPDGLTAPSLFLTRGDSSVFALPLDQPPIRLKFRNYLSRVAEPVILSNGQAEYTFELDAGDIDGDNSITVFDYDRLSAAFDASSGDANWNDMADLDGDGTVTVFDYDILSANFDRVGDEP